MYYPWRLRILLTGLSHARCHQQPNSLSVQIPPTVPADSLEETPLYTLVPNSRVGPPMTISDGLLSQKSQPMQLNYNIVEVRELARAPSAVGLT